jgi:hypothetical protein
MLISYAMTFLSYFARINLERMFLVAKLLRIIEMSSPVTEL